MLSNRAALLWRINDFPAWQFLLVRVLKGSWHVCVVTVIPRFRSGMVKSIATRGIIFGLNIITDCENRNSFNGDTETREAPILLFVIRS